MLVYCLVFVVVLTVWFLIISVQPKKYDDLRIILFAALIIVYYGGKWILKRMARYIDVAIIVTNFSFEIITEILMSSFYWCNFRMFTLRYQWDSDSYWSFPVIAVIHILSQLFQDCFRMSSAYFNFTGHYANKLKKKRNQSKSNITQWKVRGAIDTSIRFIICVYSILFITIRYGAESYPTVLTEKNVKYSAILNYSIFIIEMIHFCLIIFKPGCAGKISHQQQINMAEPLMRMYNANKRLFLAVFCASMVMASFLVI